MERQVFLDKGKLEFRIHANSFLKPERPGEGRRRRGATRQPI